jgi:hypothetical protein
MGLFEQDEQIERAVSRLRTFALRGDQVGSDAQFVRVELAVNELRAAQSSFRGAVEENERLRSALREASEYLDRAGMQIAASDAHHAATQRELS